VSEQDVEFVRRWFGSGTEVLALALEGADISGHPYFSLWWHPECIVEEIADSPDAATYSGRAGVARYLKQLGEAFDGLTYTLAEIVDGDDGVLAITDVSGRSKACVDVQQRVVQVFRLKEGAIIHATGYFDRDQALKAVGLE
jgi:ketosteroid isomerase-like protein